MASAEMRQRAGVARGALHARLPSAAERGVAPDGARP